MTPAYPSPLPREMTQECVAAWLRQVTDDSGGFTSDQGNRFRLILADAVLALVRAKCREAVHDAFVEWDVRDVHWNSIDVVVSRLLGPSREVGA